MIGKNLHRFQVQRASQHLTSFAGLPFLAELSDHLGICRAINEIPGLQQRHRRYHPSDYIMSLVMTLAAGGDTLDEVDLLRHDPGLHRILNSSLTAPNSIGEFLRRFDRSALYRLALISSGLANYSLTHLALKEITLDFDSTLVESKKDLAKKTYQGFTGYNPLLVWMAEANVWLTGVFRDGNSSPQSHGLSLLKRCHRLLPESLKIRVRADSAAYQINFMKYCHQNNLSFTITADQDVSVQEAIALIPKNKWQIIHRGKDTFALAETVHAPGRDKELPAFRLIVTRRFTGQLTLFESPLTDRAIITNFPESYSAEDILNHHNKRGTMEKAIGILKNDTGLDQLPCGTLLANAAYFQITLLTYNLLQIFKLVALPLDWKNFGWKKVRYRLLGQAAVVVQHARNLIVKLARDYVYFPIFQEARYSLLALANTS